MTRNKIQRRRVISGKHTSRGSSRKIKGSEIRIPKERSGRRRGEVAKSAKPPTMPPLRGDSKK